MLFSRDRSVRVRTGSSTSQCRDVSNEKGTRQRSVELRRAAACVVDTLESRMLLSAAGPFPRALIDPIPPAASLQPVAQANRGDIEFLFTVNYTDNIEIDATTIGDDDVFVTGPNGFAANAIFVGDRSSLSSGPAIAAMYAID